MKVAAIICEYNPFHNGHKYQIELAKKSCDAIFCVMSGSFTERGDIAIYDKWTRAKAAISGGADLVLELPVRYSLSSANGFARGAVELIAASGIADLLVFGSECGDIEKLSQIADILSAEAPETSEKIKALLDSGIGYPAAVQEAYKGTFDADILKEPNNILALEYLSALKSIKSNITPITHTRTAGYFDEGKDGFASASFIREMIKDGKDISEFADFDYSDTEKYDINKLTDIFKYKLLSDKSDKFYTIADAEPGLKNRFLKFMEIGSLDEIIDKCATKRYTKSRLRRIALKYVLNICGGFVSPSYIRVLAANDMGRCLLSEMKATATLPIVTKVADFSGDTLDEEILATDIAALCADRPIKKGRDFLISPLML